MTHSPWPSTLYAPQCTNKPNFASSYQARAARRSAGMAAACDSIATARLGVVAASATLKRAATKLHVLDADILDLGIAGQRLESFFPPVAALLVPAERKLDSPARAICIDVDLAGLDSRRQRHGLVDVPRPYARDEAVLAAIRDGRGLLDVIERDHREDRPEDFFLSHAHVRRDAIEQGRPEVVALAERRIGRPLAARRD